MTGPLEGIRVVDCASFIAAPFSAAILGEFGAEVIKVEPPGTGDAFRRFGTPTERDGDTLAFLSEGRNKRSVTLNLKSPEGRDLFRQLVARSDVLCENFRPGTLARWGIGPEVLMADNPRLVILSISGYGQDGPYRDRPGFARIAHAVAGLTHLAGMPGGTPVTPGSTSLADYMSGLYGVIGILLALRHRDAAGRGQVIDLALYESVFRALDELAPRYAKHGYVRGPEGAGTANACPHGHFQCGDGAWIAIACTSDKMFERLARTMGRPELAAPETFGKVAARIAAREEVDGIVSAWTAAAPRQEILETLIAGEVPSGPLNDIADIFADPHFAARGNLQTVEVPEVGPVTVPGVLPRLSETPGTITHLGPPLGDANRDVLGSLLGLDDEAIERLRKSGVI